MKQIRVLIVDDSVVMQKLLTRLLTSDEQIDVVGAAGDPYMARELIKKLNPDVLLLDVEMPRMDGIAFLKNIMRLRPMPVIMVSNYTEPGKRITLEAMAAGAVDYINKPTLANAAKIFDYTRRLIVLVKNAAQVNSTAFSLLDKHSHQPQPFALASKPEVFTDTAIQNHIIAIGASTGGIEAIEKIITQLPPASPGIVIVQHISRDFGELFARRIIEVTMNFKNLKINNYDKSRN